MNKKWCVIDTKKKENELELLLPSDINLEGVSASGQILVDSDSISFIYLLELDTEYVYLEIPQSCWNDCNDALKKDTSFVLTNGSNKVVLQQFKEEMEDLIENIQGNGNYGNQMVKEVEGIFL